MIVCVTDRCSRAFSRNKRTFVEKKQKTEDLKKTSARLCRVLWASVRLSDRGYGRLRHDKG